MPLPDPVTLDALVAGIHTQGFAVVTTAFSADLVRRLHAEQIQLFDAGLARPAAIGRGPTRQFTPAIRGDEILWLDPAALTPPQSEYWQIIAAIRARLNREFFLGLNDFEAHFARYPASSHYARHRDTFRDDDKRCVSCTLYLNPDWPAANGGCLRLYPPAARPVDVSPQAGTLVMFLARDLEHEVLPTRGVRHSLTGWLKSR